MTFFLPISPKKPSPTACNVSLFRRIASQLNRSGLSWVLHLSSIVGDGKIISRVFRRRLWGIECEMIVKRLWWYIRNFISLFVRMVKHFKSLDLLNIKKGETSLFMWWTSELISSLFVNRRKIYSKCAHCADVIDPECM